jgi:ankyrin repeat protein
MYNGLKIRETTKNDSQHKKHTQTGNSLIQSTQISDDGTAHETNQSFLKMARENNNEQALRLLLATNTITTRNKMQALFWATIDCRPDIIGLLLAQKDIREPINIRDEDFFCVLDHAINQINIRESIESVKIAYMLLSNGSQLSAFSQNDYYTDTLNDINQARDMYIAMNGEKNDIDLFDSTQHFGELATVIEKRDPKIKKYILGYILALPLEPLDMYLTLKNAIMRDQDSQPISFLSRFICTTPAFFGGDEEDTESIELFKNEMSTLLSLINTESEVAKTDSADITPNEFARATAYSNDFWSWKTLKNPNTAKEFIRATRYSYNYWDTNITYILERKEKNYAQGQEYPPEGNKHIYDRKDNFLLLAMNENDTNAIIFWLKNGANPNTTDDNGRSTMMLAAENGNAALVKILMYEYNADITIEDTKRPKKTALQYAKNALLLNENFVDKREMYQKVVLLLQAKMVYDKLLKIVGVHESAREAVTKDFPNTPEMKQAIYNHIFANEKTDKGRLALLKALVSYGHPSRAKYIVYNGEGTRDENAVTFFQSVIHGLQSKLHVEQEDNFGRFPADVDDSLIPEKAKQVVSNGFEPMEEEKNETGSDNSKVKSNFWNRW